MPDAERARKIITCVRGARLAWPTLTAAASENAEAWLGRAWRCRDAVGDVRDYRAVGIAGLRPQATCFPAHRQRRVHHRTLRPALHREKGRSCASALLRRHCASLGSGADGPASRAASATRRSGRASVLRSGRALPPTRAKQGAQRGQSEADAALLSRICRSSASSATATSGPTSWRAALPATRRASAALASR